MRKFDKINIIHQEFNLDLGPVLVKDVDDKQIKIQHLNTGKVENFMIRDFEYLACIEIQ
jgi:hypothetical protein